MRIKPANQSRLTDVSRLRSHPCTIIATKASIVDYQEDGPMRLHDLTKDIRVMLRMLADGKPFNPTAARTRPVAAAA